MGFEYWTAARSKAEYFPALEVLGIRSRCHNARIECVLYECPEELEREFSQVFFVKVGLCEVCGVIVARVNPVTDCIEWDDGYPFRAMPREVIMHEGAVLRHRGI